MVPDKGYLGHNSRYMEGLGIYVNGLFGYLGETLNVMYITLIRLLMGNYGPQSPQSSLALGF